MRVRLSIYVLVSCLIAILLLTPAADAQDQDSAPVSSQAATPSAQHSNPFRGLTGYEYVSMTADTFGELFRLDSNLGYNVNRYFGFDFGIPLYMATGSVGPANPAAGLMPARRSGVALFNASGAGDVYADLLFTVPVPYLTWYSTLTGALPTGKVAAGFSTGQPTFDWDNYIEHDISKLRPFADVGAANSIYDTGAFILPYTTYGFVTHLEAGTGYQLFRSVSIGASVYDDITAGEQTVFSRVKVPATLRPQSCSAPIAFECAAQSVGPAAIARDHGATLWIQAFSVHNLDFFGGYTYSAQYKLNTFSVGIGVRLGPLFRKAQSTFDKPKRQP